MQDRTARSWRTYKTLEKRKDREEPMCMEISEAMDFRDMDPVTFQTEKMKGNGGSLSLSRTDSLRHASPW